jgi:hypothetical protein
MALRPATPNDAPLLRHWAIQPHVLASDPNDDWQWETELQRAPGLREQLIIEIGGRPLGFVQTSIRLGQSQISQNLARIGVLAVEIFAHFRAADVFIHPLLLQHGFFPFGRGHGLF